MPREILILDDVNFETEVVRSGTTILVEFWASWCEPCHLVSSYVEELAEELEGRVVIAKLNTDNCDITRARYNVRGIPTLIMFKNGRDVDRKVGVASKSAISNFIYRSLEL